MFKAIRLNQQYCSRGCTNNAARAELRQKHDVTFIGIDGEGINKYNDEGKITGHANGTGTKPLVLHTNGASV
jgi:hypothetical protein